MSRSRHVVRGLSAAYVSLAFTAVTVGMTVPVALHYLSKDEFGVWVVVSQISAYLIMLEFGTTGSGVRLLMDYKDRPADGQYGTMIKTLAAVQTVQSVVMFCIGIAITPLLVRFLDVPSAQASEFRGLWMIQVAVLSLSFIGRVGSQLLTAHHRMDVYHHSQSVLTVVTFLGMWVGLKMGMGVYAMALGQGAGLLLIVAITFVAAVKLRLFAPVHARGRVSRAAAKDLFGFGGDLFFLSLGLTFLTCSQAPIITRLLGLEAAAVWGVATKLFTMGQQVVSRVFDSTATSLSEMVVRQERERLRMRFQDVLASTGALALWAAASAAVCNGPLLEVWTRGRISWPWFNDILMAAVLACWSINRVHIGFTGATKELRGIQFVYFAEGLLFLGLAYVSGQKFGMSGILASAIIADLLGSGIFGSRRTAAVFGVSAFDTSVRWLGAPLRGGFVLALLAASVALATRGLPAWPSLLIRAAVMGLAGGALVWRIGLTKRLRAELRARFASFIPARA